MAETTQDHHHHHHDHGGRHLGERGLGAAIVINVGLTVAQVVGGVLSGSLALVADALHNLSDAASLIIAFLARRIGRRTADTRMTFGYARAEIVAALVNFTTLILIGAFLAYQAVLRLLDPTPVEGWTVVVVAAVALAVDTATAVLTYAQSRESMNVKAAFLHNLADALASVGVIVGGVLVIMFGWTWVDPLLTLAIAGYVLWHGCSEIGGAIRILMLGTPEDLDPREVVAAMNAVDGVTDVHHVHLWRFDERRISLEAHLVLAEEASAAMAKKRVRDLLQTRFGIGHVTLETESVDDHCQEAGGMPA
jgi:cobalt-zinc-cadmium efflux system protein